METQIIPEMTKHFETRTNDHITRTIKYGKKIGRDLQGHDASKFQKPEYTPYVWLTWDYKMKDDGVDFELPPKIAEQGHEATLHHIRTNEHHPEYWDKNFEDGMLNKKDRDGIPEKPVDATEMPVSAIEEMCCDWCAMSEERGNNPYDWADKVIGTRYHFTPRQIYVIYDTIEKLWGKE